MSPIRSFIVGLFILVALAVFAQVRYPPPSPLPADAPKDSFSAGRAAELHRRLIGDQPHPAGSAANAAVRERLCDALRKLGYKVELQAFQHRDRSLTNILATRPGSVYGPAIVLACHYDSVRAGPGAADDGAAVSALIEIARIVGGTGPERQGRALLLLFTDGEELGLLGAKAFIKDHPRAERCGVVINLEARGASGPSLMFETSPNNGALVAIYAASCSRPVAGSLFYEVYKLLPNDTDFTVFKGAGIPGYNFAFIGSADRYHSADDTLAKLDLGSLQHHGDNALGLVSALDKAPALPEPVGDAVYFDLFGLALISWPASWSLPIQGLILTGAIAFAVGARRRLHFGPMGRGLLITPLSLAVSFGLAYGCAALFPKFRSAAELWPQGFPPRLLIFYALGFASLGVACLPFLRRAGFWAIWAAQGSWYLIASLALTWLLPTACYLLLVPLAVTAFSGIPGIFAPRSPWARTFAGLAPTLAFGVIWLPLERAFYDAFGLGGAALISLRIALILGPLLPFMADIENTAPKEKGSGIRM